MAQAHLELVRAGDGGRVGSLLAVVDETCTPPGARLLRRWLLAPLVDVAAIRRRLDAVEVFVQNPLARSRSARAPWRARRSGAARHSRRPRRGDAEGPRGSARRSSGRSLGRGSGAAKSPIPRRATPSPWRAIRPIHCRPLPASSRAALVDRPPALAREGGIFREGFDAELDETRRLKEEGTELHPGARSEAPPDVEHPDA